MIGLEDRRCLARDIDEAHQAGARLSRACEVAGIDTRTLQRWKARDGLAQGDGRPRAVRPLPAHALSEEERARLLQVANEPRFADIPPRQNSCRLHRTMNPGGAERVGSGPVRTSIQGSSGGEVAAAGEFGS